MAKIHSIALAIIILLSAAIAFGQVSQGGSDSLPATDLERVKVGDRAPDFTLESEEGKPISLSDFRGEKTVILVFYRGYW